MYQPSNKDETNTCLSDRRRYPFQQRRAIRWLDEW
jgi:hypothetical protein